MAARPRMSSMSFLEWVTHPRTAPRPTGVRKSTVVRNPARKTSRVNSYNKLDPLKQQILIQSDMREEYLRGETTLAAARRELILNPAIDAILTAALQRSEIDNRGKLKAPIKPETVEKNVGKMSVSQRIRAAKIMSYDELMEAIDDTKDDEGFSIFFYK